jgi:phage/plasmid-like protein (TIGR03299 family)
MSHEILSAVYMASQGAGWTGLGQAIPEMVAKDPAKIAELCNAMWTVEADPVYYKRNGLFVLAKDNAAQVRSDTGALLSITSKTRYHTTNRQPSDVFEAFRDDLAREGFDISHAAVLRGGATIAVSAILPPEYDVVVGKGDRLRAYVTLSTGYAGDGTKCTKGTIRVVCANTLAAAIAEARATGKIRSIRASTELEYNTLSDLVANAKDMQKQEFAVFNDMANRAMSATDVARYFADVLEINIADLDRKENGKDVISTRARNMLALLSESYTTAPGAALAHGTAWGALHAVTHYATHVKGVRDTKGDGTESARAASNMNGDAAALKARALSLVQDRMLIAA